MTIRVLLADDHALMRAGIRRLLEKIEGIEVIAEAADGEEALELARALSPDIAVLDISMPKLDGLELSKQLAESNLRVASIILSIDSAEGSVQRALRAGCSGYLLKEGAPSELEIAIRAVARGETYLSPAISRRVVTDYLSRSMPGGSKLDPLTPRQREILRLVAEGHTSKTIAQRLGLSLKTIETHRTHIMDRVGVRDVAGLVRFAIRIGLVEP